MNDVAPPMRAAMLEAKKSKQRFKLGAAIAKGKKVLSKAHNQMKTHPEFGSGTYNNLHSEGHAIYKAIRKGLDLTGSTIYVYRRHNTLAKPCPCCMGLIEKYGIKKIVFSDNSPSGWTTYYV